MSKARSTKARILDHAVDLASEVGLEDVTFGVLAQRAQMSKSGRYAHFDSKETLQCDVLDAAAARFVDVVMAPSLKRPRGLPRVRTLFERWMLWEREGLPGGCPFIAAATEFDDRPGVVRDRLRGHLDDLLEAIARAASIAVQEGHFRDDVDVDQFAFELWGTLVAYHQFQRMIDGENATRRANTMFERLIASCSSVS